MHRQEPSPIPAPTLSLEEIRTIPEIVNLSFEYARIRLALFRPLLLTYALPHFLIAQLIVTALTFDPLSRMLGRIIGFSEGPDREGILLLPFSLGAIIGLPLLCLALYVVGTAIVVAITYEVMKQDCRPIGTPDQKHDTKTLWVGARKHVGMIVNTFSGAFLSVLGLLFLVALLQGLVRTNSMLVLTLLMVGISALGSYFFIRSILVLPLRIFERVPRRASFEHSRHLIAGRWWPTVGLTLIFALLLSLVAFIDLTAIVVVRLLMALGLPLTDGIVGVVPLILCAALGTLPALLLLIPAVAVGLLFFSERERKSGTVLLIDAQRIGTGWDDLAESTDDRHPVGGAI